MTTGISLFPAVDILDRQVVRLLQGDYDKSTVYGDDPAAMIEPFKAAGASWVHVVDLNGARGETGVNDEVIKRLCAVGGIGVEVGGGVRSLERIEELAEMGVRRIVLGTKLARDHAFAQQAAERFGELLVAGIDAREGPRGGPRLAGGRRHGRARARGPAQGLGIPAPGVHGHRARWHADRHRARAVRPRGADGGLPGGGLGRA